MAEQQAFIDEQTGVRMTIEHDIPAHPRITIVPPESGIEIEELNQAILRLMRRAGGTRALRGDAGRNTGGAESNESNQVQGMAYG